jgi:hypothetical protein
VRPVAAPSQRQIGCTNGASDAGEPGQFGAALASSRARLRRLIREPECGWSGDE